MAGTVKQMILHASGALLTPQTQPADHDALTRRAENVSRAFALALNHHGKPHTNQVQIGLATNFLLSTYGW
jgi:hypothetical protein